MLVVDPTPVAARLIGEFLRALGSREVVHETEERRALDLCRELNPQLVFVERSGPRLDGESFARRLRRSRFACRTAPIIMTTADATAQTIRGARDCGVNEFLRKPFTAGDFLKRVVVVTLKPRDWIEAVAYVGPDRRRFNSGDYAGPLKRQADHGDGPASSAEALKQATQILRAAVAQFDSDPAQAVRAIGAQCANVRALVGPQSARVSVALTAVDLAAGASQPSRACLEPAVSGLLAALADADLDFAPAAARA